MKKIIVLVLLSGATSLQAAFWKCELPGGAYVVSLPTITSVSSHEYVVDGAARVTEVTVATTSAVVTRFYYLEPILPKAPLGIGQSVIDKVQEHSEEITGRAGIEPVWKKVVKNYPTTTHAHTVEYRLDSLEQLEKLRKSLETAWRTNVETAIKITPSESRQ
jgi:hypothetical protein